MRTAFPNFAQEMIADRDVTATALGTDPLYMSRSDLAERVAERRDDLGLAGRSVVVLSGDASIEWVVSYLALLEAGHVPLLAGSHTDRLVAAWNPAAIITASQDRADIEHREDGRWGEASCPDLHPELALLMSTSGSTGDPKLVVCRTRTSRRTPDVRSTPPRFWIGDGVLLSSSQPTPNVDGHSTSNRPTNPTIVTTNLATTFNTHDLSNGRTDRKPSPACNFSSHRCTRWCCTGALRRTLL